jgi:hypothetical protein
MPEWLCPRCKTVNPESAPTCARCDASPAVALEPVYCARCQFANPAHVIRCERCGLERVERPVTPSRGSWVVTLAVLLGLALVVSTLLVLGYGAGSREPSPTPPPAAREQPRYLYRVTGTNGAREATITYRTHDGSLAQSVAAPLPWEYAFRTPHGSTLQVQALADTGTVEVEIVEDGVTLKRARAEGAGAGAVATTIAR